MSDDQITKLAEKIDKGFAQVDKRLSQHDKSFELIEQKLTQHDKRFEKFFKYMENRFSFVEKKLENSATKKQVSDLSGAVAELGANLKDYHVELMLMISKGLTPRKCIR